MNQILENISKNKSKTSINIDKDKDKNQISYNNKYIKQLKITFLFSIITIFICIMLYFFIKYNTLKKEKFAKNLINQFNITTLYSKENNNNYIPKSSLLNTSSSKRFVIGLIKIDKINLLYPILSNSEEPLLKIAPCYFYGPMPNTPGNLCIAGHNNADNTIFGKLDLLNINDIIEIYDLNGVKKNYIIYKKQEVNQTDTSCLSQNTNNICEITLITCNNIKGNRLIIKAKENR